MSQNDVSAYLFHQGTNFQSYTYMGCNCEKNNDDYIYTFRTWAPNAVSVSLICDYLGWDKPQKFDKITELGVWQTELKTKISLENTLYKLQILTKNGTVNKGDPYAKYSKGGDDGASIIYTASSHIWSDEKWLNYRHATVRERGGSYLPFPVNIYEVHLESFCKTQGGAPLNYREIANHLAVYCKAMGYTHIELLPIMEHPFSGSWGYQICAYYAPSSKYGTPDDFKYFINKMHECGIGIILDWVPAHFPKDEWGLFEFDGFPLYEYQGLDRQESRTWGTRFFDLGREEVQSFLISNALYYLREFHIDGLRVDAVASMLYLDYDRSPGEWIPNKDGTNLNPEAEAFLRKLNTVVFKEFPDCLMIAEESTAIGNITKPVSQGGYGFNMKWNMGWANDIYKYLSSDPYDRIKLHSALNFPIMYAFSENYCLPISHDEVVHGKRSFIDKMYGDYDTKFDLMRCALLYMMTFPGKKLIFMGTEFAQFREWDYSSSLEWFMLDYPKHNEMREYIKSLNHFYLSHTELYERDFIESGFSWLLADENEKSTIAYRRYDNSGKSLVALINFSENAETVLLPQTAGVKNIRTLFSTNPEYNLLADIAVDDEGNGKFKISIPRLTGCILFENQGRKIYKV